MRQSSTVQFNIIFRPEPEGGFTVIVPALPGCVTYGKTLKEAKEMATDAVSGYLYSLKKHGDPIPSSDEESFVSSIRIPAKLAFNA